MSNNIEEDIKIVKELEENAALFSGGWRKILKEKEKNAIENILADRERLLEENNIYKEGNEIYKEEYNKIAKALDFKEGTLNPDASIVIKSMKQALIQLQIKANAYDSLVEKIKDEIKCLNKQEKEELKGTKGQDRYYIKQKYMYKRNTLQELLDTEK